MIHTKGKIRQDAPVLILVSALHTSWLDPFFRILLNIPHQNGKSLQAKWTSFLVPSMYILYIHYSLVNLHNAANTISIINLLACIHMMDVNWWRFWLHYNLFWKLLSSMLNIKLAKILDISSFPKLNCTTVWSSGTV